MSLLRTVLICAAAACLARAADRPAAAGAPADVGVLMARVGAYVERYFATAQRVVAVETVTMQPLQSDLSAVGFPNRFEYDIRIEWTPGEGGRPGEASVQRTLVKVNGRPPKPKDKPGCFGAVSPEPLAMLLPAQQRDFDFTVRRPGRASGRPAMEIDYRPLRRGPVSVTWRDDCVSADLPGRSAGRLWIDEDTGEVLRVDEHLVGQHDISVPAEHRDKWSVSTMTFERSSSSTRYKPVRFTDPDEVVLMPVEVESVTVSRAAGMSYLRTRHVFSKYRRFVTEGRILTD
jgi:hypothetical protein